jgi:hypothetical protein
MPTADEDLSQIERDIRKLKIEYEQFFGGGRSRPPADTQWRVETMMRRYSDRTAELNFGQRFRFNNLAQTYAKYVDMWRKKTIQKETGITQHHYGAAAKAVEAARAQQAAAHENPSHAAPDSADAAAIAEMREAANAFALSFRDAGAEKERISQLYNRLIEARQETGEAAGSPSYSAFERFVQGKTKELQAKGGNEIEYSVTVEDGKVKLKARISS